MSVPQASQALSSSPDSTGSLGSSGPARSTTRSGGRFRRLASSRRLAGGVLAGALVLALPGLASAATPQAAGPGDAASGRTAAAASAVSTIKGRCDNAITARYGQIDTLDNQMSSEKSLTSAHQSQLSGELASARSGLATLKTQIDAATTLAQLKSLCPQIVTGYRIYVLETPKVHLTMAADRELSAVTTLEGISPKLQAAITTAQGKALDVGNAPALLSQMNAQVSSAQGLASGEAGAVLGLTPAQYNSGTAKPVLVSSKGSLAQAHDDLVQARGDAQQIVTILKGLVGSGSGSTTTSTSASTTTTA